MYSSFSTEALKQAGLRSTHDRHKILDLFLEDRTWTAAQIQTEFPTMDLTTIYRNLRHFKEKSLIAETHTHNGEQHYERAGEDHHDHHVCETCDTVECIPCPIPSQQTHHLELIGTCGTCS